MKERHAGRTKKRRAYYTTNGARIKNLYELCLWRYPQFTMYTLRKADNLYIYSGQSSCPPPPKYILFPDSVRFAFFKENLAIFFKRKSKSHESTNMIGLKSRSTLLLKSFPRCALLSFTIASKRHEASFLMLIAFSYCISKSG